MPKFFNLWSIVQRLKEVYVLLISRYDLPPPVDR